MKVFEHRQGFLNTENCITNNTYNLRKQVPLNHASCSLKEQPPVDTTQVAPRPLGLCQGRRQRAKFPFYPSKATALQRMRISFRTGCQPSREQSKCSRFCGSKCLGRKTPSVLALSSKSFTSGQFSEKQVEQVLPKQCIN